MVSGAASKSFVPRVFVDDPGAIDGPSLHIQGALVRRLGRVLRLRRGDPLEVIHNESLHEVEVTRVTRDTVQTQILHSRPTRPDPPHRLELCPSLIRPQRFDLLVEKATELGASEIRPVRAARSLTRGKSGERLGRWKRLVTEAAEQCRREQRPAVHEPIEILELLSAPAPPGTLRVMSSALEPERTIPDAAAHVPNLHTVQIVVGPEGGFSSEESRAALDAGWMPVTLGPRPLRAETAGMVALAVVQTALALRTLPQPVPRRDPPPR